MAVHDTVLDFGNTNTAGKAKKPDANVWANIGFTVKAPNADGVMEDVFVTLVGVGLDNLDEAKVGSKNTPYNQQQAAKNAVRKMLVDKMMAGEPGGTLILDPTKIQVQLRRVGAKEEISTTEESNPYMISL